MSVQSLVFVCVQPGMRMEQFAHTITVCIHLEMVSLQVRMVCVHTILTCAQESSVICTLSTTLR